MSALCGYQRRIKILPNERPSAADIEAVILQLAQDAGAQKTIGPTDIARTLVPGTEWNRLMPAVRRAAVKLALEGRLTIYRKGKPVDPDDFRGVYRLGLPRPE